MDWFDYSKLIKAFNKMQGWRFIWLSICCVGGYVAGLIAWRLPEWNWPEIIRAMAEVIK